MNFKKDANYDIIIVGGGPAGSCAALYASKAGLKTLLLEKSKFPRDKICGDALSGKSVTILHDLNLLHKVQNLPGVCINSVTFSGPNHASFNVDLNKTQLKNIAKGFVIRREIFDEFLFSQAREVTQNYLENFTVRDIIMQNGSVCGVRGTNENRDICEFYGKVILGADGYKSTVAQKLGLYEYDPKHWVIALRCYYQNVKGLKDQIELHFIDEVIPGYFWIFPIDNGYANVGIGMLHEYIKQKKVDLKQAFYNALSSPYFKDRFAQATPVEKPVGWNLPVGSKRRKSYGNGFLLLGDAAGLIDPFTGEGIGNAMYSAKHAIKTVQEAVAANNYSEDFLARYEKELWAEIGNELKVSTKLQKLGRFRFLLNLVIRKAEKNPAISNLIAGMLANQVPRKRLANPLFYFHLVFR
jgi:geranylgeranyl reductase family protein